MSSKKNTVSIVHISIMLWVFLIINIVANFVIIHFSIMHNNYAQVWWKDNYETIRAINLEQIEVSLAQYKSGQAWIQQPSQQQQQAPTVADRVDSKELSQWQLTQLHSNVYILWNPDARVTFVEYSDLECPYCARLHNSGTIKQLLTDYPDDVKFIFKHFPLPSHAGAQYKAEMAECVGEQKWWEGYYAFVDGLFANISGSALWVAESIGADIDTLNNCLQSWTHTSKVNSHKAEWASLGVTGTPGNVIIDTITWEYVYLSWAHPVASFKQVIDVFLAK